MMRKEFFTSKVLLLPLVARLLAFAQCGLSQ